MMQILYEYGECSLNHSGVIVLTSCSGHEGQGHGLEDEGQGDP